MSLFEPTRLGDIDIQNRIIMAPMTRSRAGAGDVPGDLAREYYRQRASAGLIISEGTQPCATGKGYCRTPGIHTSGQLEGWSAISQAVREAGGNMVQQLMHCGRVGSHLNKDADAETVAPSAIAATGKIYSDAAGMVDFDTPRALATGEIPGVIEDYRQATENAFSAGMTGVELHCSSGYLPAQFLSTGSNHRSDVYGGPVLNRIRFVVEVLEAMSGVRGPGRVGLRICPGNPFNGLSDEDPEETFRVLLESLRPMGLAYLHVIRLPGGPVDNIALAQQHFGGPLILNDSYSFEEATAAVASGACAAISFGRHYIANPDLVRRFREGLELADFDRDTLYTPGAKGYSDYRFAE